MDKDQLEKFIKLSLMKGTTPNLDVVRNNTLNRILVEKKICTQEELDAAFESEFEEVCKKLEQMPDVKN